LSKIRAQSLKIWAKMVPSVVLTSKNGAQSHFLEVTPNKAFMIFVGESLLAKHSGKNPGYSGKNPSHPQMFACCYTYG